DDQADPRHAVDPQLIADLLHAVAHDRELAQRDRSPAAVREDGVAERLDRLELALGADHDLLPRLEHGPGRDVAVLAGERGAHVGRPDAERGQAIARQLDPDLTPPSTAGIDLRDAGQRFEAPREVFFGEVAQAS